MNVRASCSVSGGSSRPLVTCNRCYYLLTCTRFSSDQSNQKGGPGFLFSRSLNFLGPNCPIASFASSLCCPVHCRSLMYACPSMDGLVSRRKEERGLKKKKPSDVSPPPRVLESHRDWVRGNNPGIDPAAGAFSSEETNGSPALEGVICARLLAVHESRLASSPLPLSEVPVAIDGKARVGAPGER